MGIQNREGISTSEMEASAKRAARLEEINNELQSEQGSEMARILAEIEARNKKFSS